MPYRPRDHRFCMSKCNDHFLPYQSCVYFFTSAPLNSKNKEEETTTAAHCLVTIHLNLDFFLVLLQPESTDVTNGRELKSQACQGCGNCGKSMKNSKTERKDEGGCQRSGRAGCLREQP